MMNSKRYSIIQQPFREFDRLLVQLICGRKKAVLPLLKQKYDGVFYEIFMELQPDTPRLPFIIHAAIDKWWTLVNHSTVLSLDSVEDDLCGEIYSIIEGNTKAFHDAVTTEGGLDFLVNKIKAIQERRERIAQSLQFAETPPFDFHRFHAGDKLMDYEVSGVLFPAVFMDSYKLTRSVRQSTRITIELFRIVFFMRKKYRSWSFVSGFLQTNVSMQPTAFRGQNSGFTTFGQTNKNTWVIASPR